MPLYFTRSTVIFPARLQHHILADIFNNAI